MFIVAFERIAWLERDFILGNQFSVGIWQFSEGFLHVLVIVFRFFQECSETHGYIRYMSRSKKNAPNTTQPNSFHIEFLNSSQEIAWSLYQQHEVLFMIGPAGTAKTHLAMAFAIHDILNHKHSGRKKIILVRPCVESGKGIGFLPGNLSEKVDPFMMPLYDCMDIMIPESSPMREYVVNSLDLVPLPYMRGRTFNNAVAILDEGQNATKKELKMFLTRKGKNCKLVITGDPAQSDITGDVALTDTVSRLERVAGTGVLRFGRKEIVRDEWVSRALEVLDD